MSFDRASTSQGPQTTSNVTQVDKRVGVEGSGNVIQGDNGIFSYFSKDLTNTQRIKGDNNFAPVFNFTGTGISRPVALTAPIWIKPGTKPKY
jgi:hypothetical protein